MTEILDVRLTFTVIFFSGYILSFSLIVFKDLHYLEKLSIDFLMQKIDIAFMAREREKMNQNLRI